MSDFEKCKECKYTRKSLTGWTYCGGSQCEMDVRADERTKAEQDFQNSDYWNDYLAKMLSDERERILEHQTIIYDLDGIGHKVVLVKDIKEEKEC